MQGKSRAILVICGVLLVTALLLVWHSPLSGPPPVQDTIVVGTMSDESSALVYIAQEKGYFSQEGLNLTLVNYPNGAAAVRGLENRDVDLALSSEFPLVSEISTGHDIVIAGTIDKYYGTFLVCRRDRGIASATDLSGKTIALSKNSVGEFYLGRFLGLNGISPGNVTLVDLSPAAAESGLSNNGSIDAAVVTPIAAYRLTSAGADRYVVIPITSGQATYKIVAGNRDWVTDHSRALTRFLLAMGDASKYAVEKPEDSRAIVVKRVNASPEYILEVWPEHQYGLSFDQSLLIAMEGEAAWMNSHNQTLSAQVPDFLNNLYTQSMKSADPGAVSVIGPG